MRSSVIVLILIYSVNGDHFIIETKEGEDRVKRSVSAELRIPCHLHFWYSRPEHGEDYAWEDYEGFNVCLNAENFAGTDLFALKFVLKQNPGKNIENAKEFFRERGKSLDTRIVDYDDQAKTIQQQPADESLGWWVV